jgi:hypothetical protein
MSTFVIRVNGVDITNDIIIDDAEFTSQASGSPGTCRFRVKDMDMSYLFTIGHELTLDIDGRRMWGGYVTSVKRAFFFKVEDTETRAPCEPISRVPRALVVEGVDYNILFRKRFLYNRDEPTDTVLQSWPAGTHDDVQIRYMCENLLFLDDDGLDTTTKVEYVGTPNPDKQGNPAGAGQSWESAMQAIAYLTGAVFYIDPDKALVYTDVDTPNATYGLSDVPGAGQLGYRDPEIVHDATNMRNDALVWGAGQGPGGVKFHRTEDATAIATHNRWQIGDFRQDMWRQESVNKRAESYVYGSPQNKRGGKDDAISVRLTLFEPAFRVAEKVAFESVVYGYSDVIPIRRQRITFISPTEARYELVLSHYVDQPWNIFEWYFPDYHFPPIKPIITEPPKPPDYPHCPVQPASMLLGRVIFSDTFDRETGKSDSKYGCGTYRTGPYTHNPESNVTIDATKSPPTGDVAGKYVVMDYPSGNAWEVLAAVDGTGVSFPNGQTSFSTPSVAVQIKANGQIDLLRTYAYVHRIDDAFARVTMSFDSIIIDSNIVRGHYYVRFGTTMGISYVKIWPQDEDEPGFYLMILGQTGPPSTLTEYVDFIGFVSGPIPYISFYGTVKLNAITAWAVGGQMGVWSAFEDQEGTAWDVRWCAPHPGDGTYLTTCSDGSITERDSTTETLPFATMWMEDALFLPDAMRFTKQRERTVSLKIANSTAAVIPNAIRITGQATAATNSPGLAEPYGGGGIHGYAAAEIVAYTMGANVHGQNGYVLPTNGYVINAAQTLFTYAVPTRAGPPGGYVPPEWVDFDVRLDGGLINDGLFQWGHRLIAPDSIPGNMPVMGNGLGLPHSRTITTQLRHVLYWIEYFVQGCGVYFCVPADYSGGTVDTKICQTFPLDNPSPGTHTFTLENPYRIGSLEVTVDGLQWQKDRDYIESDPENGVFDAMAPLVNARELRVCYYQPITIPPISEPGGSSGGTGGSAGGGTGGTGGSGTGGTGSTEGTIVPAEPGALAAAISAASDGDRLLLRGGDHVLQGIINTSKSLTITNYISETPNITWGPSTRQDGLYFQGGPVVVSNITFTAGSGIFHDDNGSAMIECDGELGGHDLLVENCTFVGHPNMDHRQQFFYQRYGTNVTCRNSVFIGNGTGGFGFHQYPADTTNVNTLVDSCTFRDFLVSGGVTSDSRITVTNSHFFNNNIAVQLRNSAGGSTITNNSGTGNTTTLQNPNLASTNTNNTWT